jgi:hypothetical protein
MFWFAFTTYPSVPWIVPILAGIPFGWGVVLVFASVFNCFVDAYREWSASAMAAKYLLSLRNDRWLSPILGCGTTFVDAG